MTEARLDELDDRAARARRSLERMAAEVSAPAWRPRQKRPAWLAVAAAVVAVVVIAAGLVTLTRGDEGGKVDVASGDQTYYAPGDTLGLPLLRAVRGDEIPAPGTGFVALYGSDPELRGTALAVTAQQVFPPLDLQAGDDERLVDVDGTKGLLHEESATGLVVVSWQPEEGALLTVLGKGLDPAQVLTAAADVESAEGAPPKLRHPASLGMEEVISGRVSDVIPIFGGGAPGRRGTMLAYGAKDGTGPALTVVTGPGDHRSVDAIRLTNPGAEDLKVGTADAVLGQVKAGGETFGWVVAWSSSDGTVIRVMGLDLSREEVLRAAGSVRRIRVEAFQSLADSDGFNPDDELPGMEADQVVVTRGELDDGSRWRVEARDPRADGPVAVTFTWMHDQSSTSTGIEASSARTPLLLASRSQTEPEHLYGFAASAVDRLWWEAPDGGGGQVSLFDVGDSRGRYFEVALPAGSGVVTLFASDDEGELEERTPVGPEATVEIGTENATTSTVDR